MREQGCREVAWSMKREEELREQGCREVAYSFKREEGLSEQGCKATEKKREEE